MRIFISHSWKNKTIVQRATDELTEADYDIWIDAVNLLPGSKIQKTIDEVLSEMDVVLLFWSEASAASSGVAAEIETALKLGKTVIPCKLDATPFPGETEAAEFKGVSFADFVHGIGRLKATLLNFQTEGLSMSNEPGIQALNKFSGTLETTDNLLRKQNLRDQGSEEDKDFWIRKIENTEQKGFDQLSETNRIAKEVQAFLQAKMAELQEGLNNPEVCNRILNELKSHPYADRAGMPVFIEKLQTICDTFQSGETNETIKAFAAVLEQKTEETYTWMKNTTGWLVGNLFDAAFEEMKYFMLKAPEHLAILNQRASEGNVNPLVNQAAEDLITYIKTPGGIIDNNQFGFLGYIDDAFLIHTVCLGLIQQGQISADAFNTNWETVESGAEKCLNFIDADTRNKLTDAFTAYFQNLMQGRTEQDTGQQQAIQNLQRSRNELWEARITGLQGDMNYGMGPVY